MAKTTLKPLVGLSEEELENRVPNREGNFIWLEPELPDYRIPFRIGLIPELDSSLSIGDLLELTFSTFRVINIFVTSDAITTVVAKPEQGGENFDASDAYDAPEFTGELEYLEH